MPTKVIWIGIVLCVLVAGAVMAFLAMQEEDSTEPTSRVHARFALDLSPERLDDLAAASVRGFKRDDLRRIADKPAAERDAMIANWRKEAAAMLGQSTFDLVFYTDGTYEAATALGGSASRGRGTWVEGTNQMTLTATHSEDAALSSPQVTVVPYVDGVLRVPWFDTHLHLTRTE